MTQDLTIVCYGDTDWFACRLDTASIRHGAKIFGTPSADPLIEAAGNWLGTDQWDLYQKRTVPGQDLTYETMLTNILQSLISGTKSLEAALSAGHNVIGCIAYRENGSSRETVPKYGLRFSGSFYFEGNTPQECAEAVESRLPFVVPMLLEDMKEGYLDPESPIVQNLILPNVGEPEQGSPEVLPTGVKFQTFTDQDGSEKLAVTCCIDHDQAQAWAASPRISLEVIQGITPTPHGPLSFLVWAVQADQPTGLCIEQFLDPSSLHGPRFKAFSKQESFDFAIIDRTTGKSIRHISYPADGIFEKTRTLAEVAETSGGTNMEMAVSHFVQSTDMNDLLPERLRR